MDEQIKNNEEKSDTSQWWRTYRRDIFAILLITIDGYDFPDAVAEADNLIAELAKGE